MSRPPSRWLVALLALLLRRRSHPEEDERLVAPASPARRGARASPAPRAELAVIALFGLSALFAVGFLVVYAIDALGSRTQLLGVTLGASLACASAALIAMGKRLVPEEQLEEDYPEPAHPEDQEAIAQMVHESGEGLTRKRLLIAAGGAAGSALAAAAAAPALSLGPWINTNSLYDTPWEAGRRLVDEQGRPLRADAIARDTFYTAFPEGAPKDELGAPLVLVRLAPALLRLPPERARWAPGGILAYSKICTHAGCAIALYRAPLFDAAEPRPALVCPCHYSTFDPAEGGTVTFGPAGRDLPQLPLRIDAAGHLRAAGNFSGPVGPSWAGVRGEPPR